MNKCAIVIPIYQEITSNDELFSFERSLSVFSKRDIYIAIPECLSKYGDELVKLHPKLNVMSFENRFFQSVKQYNRLLTSLDFYTRFESYSHLCICQLDVLSLQDTLDYWMEQNWDYIGAPIFEGYNETNSHAFKTTLNGGFSLRNVMSAITVLRSIQFRYCRFRDLIPMEKNWFLILVRVIRDGMILNYNLNGFRTLLNEDLFWTFVTPRAKPWFSIPSPEIAQYFAFDKHPEWLYNRNGGHTPVAIHAWKRFSPQFSKSILMKLGDSLPKNLVE